LKYSNVLNNSIHGVRRNSLAQTWLLKAPVSHWEPASCKTLLYHGKVLFFSVIGETGSLLQR